MKISTIRKQPAMRHHDTSSFRPVQEPEVLYNAGVYDAGGEEFSDSELEDRLMSHRPPSSSER